MVEKLEDISANDLYKQMLESCDEIWCGILGTSGEDPLYKFIQKTPVLKTIFSSYKEYDIQSATSVPASVTIALAVLVPILTLTPLLVCIGFRKMSCPVYSMHACAVSSVFVALLGLVLLVLSLANSGVVQPVVSQLSGKPETFLTSAQTILQTIGIDESKLKWTIKMPDLSKYGVSIEPT